MDDAHPDVRVRGPDHGDIGEPDAYLVSETATRLRISRNTCYELIRQGQIPSVRIGRRILVPREALENLLNVNKE